MLTTGSYRDAPYSVLLHNTIRHQKVGRAIPCSTPTQAQWGLFSA